MRHASEGERARAPQGSAAAAARTRRPRQVTDHPCATEEEVAFILDALSDFLSVKVGPVERRLAPLATAVCTRA